MKTASNFIEHDFPSDEQIVIASEDAVKDESPIIRTETIFSFQKPGNLLDKNHKQVSLSK